MKWLSDNGANHTFPFGIDDKNPTFYNKLLEELEVCGAGRYAEDRRKLMGQFNSVQVISVGAIATVLSAVVGA